MLYTHLSPPPSTRSAILAELTHIDDLGFHKLDVGLAECYMILALTMHVANLWGYEALMDFVELNFRPCMNAPATCEELMQLN